ncbi:MAG TPA: hypothetical protein VLV16_03530 [Gemmatimonadales bacterium]|nr:hypothetical protein [Gemmatimonadales bacterium]
MALALSVHAACAQRVAATELSAGAVATIATRDFWGGNIGLARRVGGRRAAVDLSGGSVAGAAAMRVRATAQLVVRPQARSGVSPYGALGLAWAGAEDAHGAAYLAVVAGLEAAPARPAGWYVEIGVEGGVRVAAGLRWRRPRRGG